MSELYAALTTKPPYAKEAQVIREASLRSKADETAKYLSNAHEMMDALEEALHGPQPRDAQGETAGGPMPGHPGLRWVTERNSEVAASLVGRINTLLGSL